MILKCLVIHKNYNSDIRKIDNTIDEKLKRIHEIIKNRKDLKSEEKINYNPYEKLNKLNLDKNSKVFANEWLKVSIEDLNYNQDETNFDSYTFNDLINYEKKFKKMHDSSSKRKKNEFIENYDKDIKNQLKIVKEKINQQQKGSGIKKGIGRGNGNDSSLIYYNNPQQLIDRLKLLIGSKKAGNTNPEIDNEIIGISDELIKKGLIMNEDYSRFMNKNLIKFFFSFFLYRFIEIKIKLI